MSTQVQWKRGTTGQNNTYTGAVAEITVDTTLKQIRLHDGVTAGGTTIAGVSSTTTNIGGGIAGQILYQAASGQTGFITPGPNGSFLISNGTTSTFGNTVTNLSVSGQSVFQGVTATLFTATTVTVNGNATVGGTLGVTGLTTLQSVTATLFTATTLTVNGDSTIKGTANHTGQSIFQSVTATLFTATTVTVNGDKTVKGVSYHNGQSIFQSVTATLLTATTLTVNGNGTIGGTFGVTGQTTLAGLTATNITGTTLTISGQSTLQNVNASIVTATTFFGNATLATTATNLANGAAGSIPYQSAVSATTFLAIGTNGFVMTSNGSAPVWSALGSISAGSATTATNLAGGVNGNIPYQSAPGITAFVNTGTLGQLFQSNSPGSAPSWVSTSSLLVGLAANIVGGAGGSLHYQSAANTTAMLGIGGNNSILVSNGSLPSWTTSPTIGGNLTVVGNLVVQGVTTTVDSTVTNIADPIITIGGGTAGAAPTADDAKDRGIAFQWHNGTTARTGFFGFDRSTRYFTFLTSATITTEITAPNGGTTKGAIDANLAGGAAQSLVYQSAADVTAFLSAGTAGHLLQTNGTGSAPSWVSPSLITANTATNLAGGVNGSIPYQTGPGATAFVTTGTLGQILQSNSPGSAPTWIGTSTLLVGLTVNDLGGSAMALRYQSSANTSAFLAAGTAGQILQTNSTGAAPAWVGQSTLSVGTATNANNLATVQQTASAAYYPTFVDSNNVTGTQELYYTTSSFAINPATGLVTLGSLTVTNQSTLQSVTATLFTATTLTVNGNATVGGTLNVSGQTTLAGLTATNITGTTLTISGQSALQNVTAGIVTATTFFGNLTGNATLSTTATNLANGTAGAIPYQSAVSATTFLSIGTNGFVLTSNGSTPVWSALSGLSAGNATTATNLGGGVNGSVPYQSAPGVTAFVTTGTLGQLFQSNSPGSAPSWVSTSTLLVGLTVNDLGGSAMALRYNSAANTSAFVAAGTAGQILQTNGTGSAPTWISTGTLVVGISANLLGGVNGSIPYQTGPNTTAFVSTGTAGQLFQSNSPGSAPTWINPSTLTAGTATNANNLSTVQQTAAANYYPTFVDSNNVTGLQEAFYTTSSFAINPGTGAVTLAGALTVNSANANTTTNTSNAIYTAGGAWIDKTLVVGGETTFKGSVVFQGTNTFVYSSSTIYTDNLISLHAPVGSGPGNHTWTADDGRDIGFMFHYYKTVDKDAFLGFDNATQYLEWFENGSEVGGVFSGTTYGIFKTGGIQLANSTPTNSSSTGALTVTGGLGVGGGVFVNGVVTATTFFGNLTGNVTGNSLTANTATSLANGTAGAIPYQSAVSATTFLSIGTNGFVLTSNGSTPTWQGLGTLTAGTSTNANNILTVQQPVAGIYYPTFVTLNSTTGAYQPAYTTSSFIINAATGVATHTGGLAVNGLTTVTNVTPTNSTTTGALQVAGGVGIGLGLFVGGIVTATNLTLNAVRGDNTVAGTQYSLYYNIATKELTTSTAASGSSTGTTSTFVIANSTPTSSTATGALIVYGGVGIWGGTVHGGITTVTNVTAASSTNSGAFQVAGGVGIGGNLYAGNIYTNGSQVTPTSIQEFTATGGQTTFTIAGGYTVGQIQVFANGIQLGTGDYTASNASTVVLGIGRNVNDIVRIVASQNYVISAQQAYTFNQYTASGSQTTFATSYNTATVQVFANGALISPTAYTANNGTSIIFGSGRTGGDIIAVISFNSVSIANAISSSGGTVNGTLNINGTFQVQGVDILSRITALSVAMGM